MRAVVQRVSEAKVTVEGEKVAHIENGLMVLLDVGQEDQEQDVIFLADKLANLRIFSDDNGRLNLSVLDIDGEVLVVSQFTLYGDCRKGRRPSFSSAAPPELAKELYERFVDRLRSHGLKVETGVFQAHMEVSLINDGPVTLLMSSQGEF